MNDLKKAYMQEHGGLPDESAPSLFRPMLVVWGLGDWECTKRAVKARRGLLEEDGVSMGDQTGPDRHGCSI